MLSIRKLALMGIAALMLCAVVASSASALTAYDQVSTSAIGVGEGVTGNAGTSTLSGSFFGVPVTITCTSSQVKGTVTANGGATVLGNVSSATWSGCSSNRAASCTVTKAGTWTNANSGGLAATSTTSVGVAPGSPTSTNYIDVTSCLGGLGTCHVTGATASYGGLANVAVGVWTNANANQLAFTNLPIANAGCTSTSQSWNAAYALTRDTTGAKVGLRTP